MHRVGFIKRAQRLGFTLAEAADLLALHELATPCAEVERRALAKVAEIEERIATFTAVKDGLLAPMARCAAECPTGCGVLLAEDLAPRNDESVSPRIAASSACRTGCQSAA